MQQIADSEAQRLGGVPLRFKEALCHYIRFPSPKPPAFSLRHFRQPGVLPVLF